MDSDDIQRVLGLARQELKERAQTENPTEVTGPDRVDIETLGKDARFSTTL